MPEIKGLRGDFYNMMLEVPASLPGGYCPLYPSPSRLCCPLRASHCATRFTDPRHEGTIASRLCVVRAACSARSDLRCRCHSCDPNCTTGVVSHEGKLRVALYTIAHVEYGCVLSYNYHCNTDDEEEYRNSKCLCGAESCETLYVSLAAGHFDGIMESRHTMVNRLAMLARACKRAVCDNISCQDADLLASVGFGEKIFRDSPAWLKCYCAQVVEFIKLERELLPQHLSTTKSRLFSDSLLSDNGPEDEADGVQGLRLQNLAITIDRVLAFLRRHREHRVAPLIPYTDLEAAHKLVFDDNSIWSKLKEFVESRGRSLSGLKGTLEDMKCSGKNKQSIEAAREVLRHTATALRSASPNYSPCADVLEVCSITPIFFDFVLTALTRVDQNLAATETFYHLAKYDSVQSDALQLSAEDVETGAKVQLPSSACLYVEQQTLSPTFVLEQLMFWFHQPQRKIDVLTLSGAGELPCPTDVLRCCMGAGLSDEDQKRHQDLLAGFAPPPSCRRNQLHQFAAELSKAFIGCAALCRSMKELQEATSFKWPAPTLLLRHNQATSMAKCASKRVRDSPSEWRPAEKIIAQKEEATFNKKRKRSVKVLYLVQWRDQPLSEATWEPKCNINAELFAEWTCRR